MKNITLFLIKTYQKLAPKNNFTCRFSPTCSQYTYEAIVKYGTIKGLLMGVRRLLHCHPYTQGGYDPVK